MGKTARWFRGLLGLKKSPVTAVASSDSQSTPKEKKRWSFVRSSRDRDRTNPPRSAAAEGGEGSIVPDPNRHAIAVAAVADAYAAAAVVELTSSSAAAHVSAGPEECAAVMIQAAFRGYLARRALRALKGLVKLQALVRGYIVRKQALETLRCMQALVRVQSLVRAQAGGRTNVLENRNLNKSCSQTHLGPETPEKYERASRVSSSRHAKSATLKRSAWKTNRMDVVDQDSAQMGRCKSGYCLDGRYWNYLETPKKVGAADKIVEIDHGKSNINSKQKNTNLPSSQSTFNSHSFATFPDSPSKESTTAQLSIPSPSSVQMQSPSPLRIPIEVEDSVFDTAENSPQFYSASSRAGSTRRGPFTPSKSECSQSFFSVYSDYPNYMADTESSRAKFRSQSAPKQRPKFEKSSSAKRFPIHGMGDTKAGEERRSASQRPTSLHAKFTSKAYPGSGRLDRLGVPINEAAAAGYNNTNWNRW